MQWDKETVGKIIQDARLKRGLTYEEVGEMAGVKPCVLSSLEKGRHRRTPHADTQAKIEEALGIVLPIPRGHAIRSTLYVPHWAEQYVAEAMTRFQTTSRGGAIMLALKEWSIHRAAVDKWNAEHPGGEI